jgi:integrase
MPRMNLTDRFVAGVKAETQQIDYFDEKNPGLGLRVSPGGRKAWTFIFTSPRDGKRARATLGAYPGLSLAGARTRTAEARTMLATGDDPRKLFGEQAAGFMNVAGLVDVYLADPEKAALRSFDEIARRLRRNVVPVIGALKIAEMRRRDVRNCTDPIVARGSAAEASRVFEDVRAMIRWAVEHEYLDANPIDGMAKPGGSKPRERCLDDDEIKIVWNALPTAIAKSKTVQRILRLCLITAQRVGEVAGMRLDELNLKTATWLLPGERTKNAEGHSVPLSPQAIAIIEEAIEAARGQPGAKTWVFPSGDAGLPAMAVAKTLGRAQEASEEYPTGRLLVPHFTAHDLRRSALTGMAKLGVAPIVLGHVANHLSTTKAGVTLQVYSKYTYDKEKRAALELWAERVAAIVVGDRAAAEVVSINRGGAA